MNLTPEERLRRVSFMWDCETAKGLPLLADPVLVPVLRSLLDGYHWIEEESDGT